LPITSIIGGIPSQRGSSNEKMKRRLTYMLYVNVEACTSLRRSKRSVLGFNDDKYNGDTHNEIFPIIIVVTNVKHDVSRVLVDEGSSYNVMY
jgi:predicted ribosome-associated RNA-binding protein Tma20